MMLQPEVRDVRIKLVSVAKHAVFCVVFASFAGLAALVHAQALPSAGPAAATGTGLVYTANEGANSLSIIELDTGQVTEVPLTISPHNVQASAGGSLLAVGMVTEGTGHASAGPHSEGGSDQGRLVVMGLANPRGENARDIEVGREPAHVIADWQELFAFVTNAMDNNLSVVALGEAKVIDIISTGASPHGLRMSPEGNEIYVANTGDDSVSIINVADRKEVARIPVGKAPAQVGFTPDGRFVYVSSTVGNSVAVVDTKQRKVIATVPVGRNPIQVYVTPDGRYVYVANEGTSDDPDNRTSVIDVASNRVVATLETGKGAHGVVVGDDGSHAFVANSKDNTVAAIETSRQRVTRTFHVGKGAGGVTYIRALR